jgi:hypothetical protein
LLLGILFTAEPVIPLEASVATSNAKEFSLAVSGVIINRDPLSWLAVIDRHTNLPIAIHYRDQIRMPPAVPIVPGRSGRGTLPPVEEVDLVMHFEDRVRMDRIMVPTRIWTEGRGIVLEDIRIKSFLVNPKLGVADFVVPR